MPLVEIQRTRVKICGLTRPAEVSRGCVLGADALGLVFHPDSPRFITPELASTLLSNLPPFVTIVGLFVNAPEHWIAQVLKLVPLDLLQFHGSESASDCERWGLPYIKAVRMKPGLDLLQYAVGHPRAQALLVDAWVHGIPGGTGQTFDWDRLPAQLPLPLVMSGGLTPENVGLAMRKVRPWAVDVSSGVELVPGQKDLERMARFIQEVRDEDLRFAG